MKFIIAVFFLLTCAFQSLQGQYPETGVEFSTGDSILQRLYDRAEKMALENIVDYGSREVLIEGAQYRSIWLETQPMGGYMYAKRDIEIAKNNIGIFIDYQRDDGRLPGVIYNRNGRIEPNYCQFQGLCFPMPAFELYFLLGHDTVYLKKVYDALRKFDAYLWKTRDSDGNGCLETWCIYDTGEDNSLRFNGFPNAWSFDYPPSEEAALALTPEELSMHCKETSYDSTKAMVVPIESMDVMSYSYSCREVLALISGELKNGEEALWRRKAGEVKDRIRAYLWDNEKSACYDRDRDNITMPVLLHNNLRCMYYGSFSQDMSDMFIKHHLMNPDEFFTPVPLPSVAVNDPLFRNASENNWSGQPQALTYQRSIQALENYGHYAELTMIGLKFLKTISHSMRFTQQFDPFTGGIVEEQDGYGPAVLATLEYISRFCGIHITQDKIWWSCLDSSYDYDYSQKWNGLQFTMKTKGKRVFCNINGKQVLTFTKGARVVTYLKGELIEVVGIAPEPRRVKIRNNHICSLDVEPNAVYRPGSDGKIEIAGKVAFFGRE